MGLFDKLFGRADSSNVLMEWGLRACDEMERVYRNQLELTPSRGSITGVGLLKARLLSATVFHTSYFFACARGSDDTAEFMQACSGIAMRPFSQAVFSPPITREQATSIGTNFMLKAARLLRDELRTGPSNLAQRTPSFEHLVGMYHHCLAESCPAGSYTQAVRNQLNE
jgi:hypothetical protein